MIPRLAMINDIAGVGRCSTTVALPVISTMQVQVCPVPTSILSNHLGFSSCYFDDYTPHMQDYLDAWKKLHFSFDGLYCGFLGSELQMDIVTGFLQDFKPGLFVLDPVMGDHGKAYSTITKSHCEHMKKLVAHAQILTPNLTEACLLTDTPYHEGVWTEGELKGLCEKLALLHGIQSSLHRNLSSSDIDCCNIVITGITEHDMFINYIWQDGITTSYCCPRAGQSRPGTGDLFTSILTADALHRVPFRDSVKKAADFVALCIRGSEEAGTPVQEGVIFEQYLRQLF